MSLEPVPLTRSLLLGLLAKKPGSTGYDLINSIIPFSNNLIEWKSGTVYAELRKLDALGIVRSQQEIEGRKRRIYYLTSEGKSELMRIQTLIRKRIKFVLEPLLSITISEEK